MKRTQIALAVNSACRHIGMQWRIANGLQPYAS